MLILKIIFFKKIILIYFKIKDILKNNYYHNTKHALKVTITWNCDILFNSS